MRELFKFEMLKIFKRKTAQAAVLALFAAAVLLSVSTYLNMYAFDGKNNEGRGSAAVQIDMGEAEKYEGPLTDEKVLKMLDEYKIFDMHGMNAAYIYENALQSSLFYRFAAPDGTWNNKKVSDVFGDEKINIGYTYGWLKTSGNMVKIFILLMFVIAVIVSPVFSGERGGADEIILTSRYGRTKCVYSKISAGLFASLATSAGIFLLMFFIALAFYGKDGLSCSALFAPSEFAESFAKFDNISCGGLLARQGLLALTGAVFTLGVSLFSSAAFKTKSASLIFAAAFLALPTLLAPPETSTLFKLAALSPICQAQFISLMSIGKSFALLAAPVSLAVFAVGSAAAKRIFTKALC